MGVKYLYLVRDEHYLQVVKTFIFVSDRLDLKPTMVMLKISETFFLKPRIDFPILSATR